MDLRRYFTRIGLDPDTKIEYTLDFLKKIQYGHVTCIPYENLDILKGKSLSFDKEDLFEKIVINSRGGYCFEVNAFLAVMLREMGFSVKDRFARFLRGEAGVPMRRHRVVIVSLDEGDFLLDVGVGQIAPKHPLKIEADIVQEQFGEKYKFSRDDFLGNVVFELKDGIWQKYISFTDDDSVEADFVPTSYFCEKSPDSIFNKSPIVSIKTKDGRKTVNGDVYKEFCGEKLIYIEENISDDRLLELLYDKFNIKLM